MGLATCLRWMPEDALQGYPNPLNNAAFFISSGNCSKNKRSSTAHWLHALANLLLLAKLLVRRRISSKIRYLILV